MHLTLNFTLYYVCVELRMSASKNHDNELRVVEAGPFEDAFPLVESLKNDRPCSTNEAPRDWVEM